MRRSMEMGFGTLRPRSAINLSAPGPALRHVMGKLNSEKGDNWVIFSGCIQGGTYHFPGKTFVHHIGRSEN